MSSNFQQLAANAKASLDSTQDILREREELSQSSQRAQIKTSESNEQLVALARAAEARAASSEKEARTAKRHAIWANIIALVAIGVSLFIA